MKFNIQFDWWYALAPWLFVAVVLACCLIALIWHDGYDRRRLDRMRRGFKGNKEVRIVATEPNLEVKQADSAATETASPGIVDLSKITLGDLKSALAEAAAMNKPGKYVALLQSRRFQACILAIGGVWLSFAAQQIDFNTAVYSSVAAVIGWMHSDATRVTE